MATHLFLGRFLLITLVILFGLVGVARAGHSDAVWRKKTAAKLKTLLSKHHLPCANGLGTIC